eukprot:9490810-Pyramimonas_sp.AAC.1
MVLGSRIHRVAHQIHNARRVICVCRITATERRPGRGGTHCGATHHRRRGAHGYVRPAAGLLEGGAGGGGAVPRPHLTGVPGEDHPLRALQRRLPQRSGAPDESTPAGSIESILNSSEFILSSSEFTLISSSESILSS